jgi:hypothetical protein
MIASKHYQQLWVGGGGGSEIRGMRRGVEEHNTHKYNTSLLLYYLDFFVLIERKFYMLHHLDQDEGERCLWQ